MPHYKEPAMCAELGPKNPGLGGRARFGASSELKSRETFARRLRVPPSRLGALASAVAALGCALLAEGALADPAPRYAPVTQGGAPLYPQSSSLSGASPSVFNEAVGAVDYRLNSAVGRLVVEVARDGVPADGQSPVLITVKLFGRKGEPLDAPAFITIEHSGGRVLLDGARTDEFGPRGLDADRATPGVQLRVEKGEARFQLLAPFEPQDVRLRITAGDQSAEGTISFVPEVREMVATGLLEGVINLRRGGQVIEPVRNSDPFEREIRAWSREFSDGKANVAARAAFFLKGMVRGDVLLTAAYDSDKDTRARLLRDVRPEEFYPVYGDSSLKGFDARSSEKLYVRLDQNKNYLLYGDFETGAGFSQRSGGGAVAALQQRSLGNYNRSATGLRAHHESDRWVGNVFATRDTLRQVVEEFASQGSGPYGLKNYAVLEGSAKVEAVVRDRNQPSRILSATPLSFGIDYSYEPFSGRIILNTFLPSVDANLNPVSLRVSYEVDQGGESFWVGGVDGQVKLGGGVELGGSLVDDTNPLAAYRLASANASWRLGDKTLVVAEVARSTSEVNTNPANGANTPGLVGQAGTVPGDAWRVEAVHEGETVQARGFVGRSDPEFNNPAAPLQGGRAEAHGRADYKLTDDVKLFGEGLRSEDLNAGGGLRKAAQVGVNARLSDRITVEVGLRKVSETDGTVQPTLGSPFASTDGLTGSVATGSGGGAVGFGNQLIDPATGIAVINPGAFVPTTGGTANASSLGSTSVRLGLGWRATDKLSLGGEVEHDVAGDARRRFALGADYQLAEGTKLYGRYEHQTGYTSPYALTEGTPAAADRQSDVFVFGISTTYLKETQLFSEYRMRDALSARDLQLASGVRNVWNVAPGWRVSTAAENVRVLSGDAADTQAIALGVDYTADPLWKGSSRVELRRAGDLASTPANDRFDTVLWQLTGARKMNRDWTLLARNYLLQTTYAARGDVWQDRIQVGAAYRDTDTNRVNALGKYEYRIESDESGAEPLKFRSHLVSMHADWHPTRPWWFTGRAAALWRTDLFEGGVNDSFKGVLLSGRSVWDVTEHWDLGVMASVMAGQGGARQNAFGVEAGYLLQQNLWLSAGYNFSGFTADRQLQGYEYTRPGVYLRLRFKFDEDLFKSQSPSVNRTLEP
jgi:hypothetical protein